MLLSLALLTAPSVAPIPQVPTPQGPWEPNRYTSAVCSGGVLYSLGYAQSTEAVRTLLTARELSTGALLWSTTEPWLETDVSLGDRIALLDSQTLTVVETAWTFGAGPFELGHGEVSTRAIEDGRRLTSHRVGGGGIEDSAISPDGTKVAMHLRWASDSTFLGGFYVVDLDSPTNSFPTIEYSDPLLMSPQQFAFAPDSSRLYLSYEAASIFTSPTYDLAFWDLSTLELTTIDLVGPAPVLASGVELGSGLGVSPDGSTLYLSGDGLGKTSGALDAFTLEPIWVADLRNQGTETCLAVSEAGPLFFGKTLGLGLGLSKLPRLTWIEGEFGKAAKTAVLDDPCFSLRASLRPEGEDFLFLLADDFGCNPGSTLIQLELATGVPQWIHTIDATFGGFSNSPLALAYDPITHSLCAVGHENGRPLTYVVDAETGGFAAAYLD